MVRNRNWMLILFLTILLLIPSIVFADEVTQSVHDDAGLLTENEIERLETLASEYQENHDTAYIILTTNNPEGIDVVDYMGDFYDEHEPGPNGNAAILTLDMKSRDIYLAGFYKAKEYLDDERLTLIREKITPDLSAGNYYAAFETYLEKANRYMEFRPGVNPESFFFKWWVQIIIALLIAGVIVGIFVFNTGGRVTVNDRTYIDEKNTRVNSQRDVYLRKTVTKKRKPSNNNNGGGGGGGITGGGHSHSGSRGKF